jgi:hypothetical protein
MAVRKMLRSVLNPILVTLLWSSALAADSQHGLIFIAPILKEPPTTSAPYLECPSGKFSLKLDDRQESHGRAKAAPKLMT